MKIISLGGVGGCDLAQALRHLNQPTYPYDWIIATQSFIINSFNEIDNFFIFDETRVYDNTKLLAPNKNAIILHDFNNFILEKEEVITKYKRRFERLNYSLHGNNYILFVRIYDNLQEKLNPPDYYNNNILIRDNEEDINKWEIFINDTQIKYNNKKIKLLVITSTEDICNKPYNNIIIHFTKDHKNPKMIYNIIKYVLTSASTTTTTSASSYKSQSMTQLY
jgi:hypothetical protein